MQLPPEVVATDATLARSLGRLLERIGAEAPRALLPCMPLLAQQCGSDSYGVRNAVVSGVAAMLCADADEEAGDDTGDGEPRPALREAEQEALVDLLMERMTDVSAHSRSRLLQVWRRVAEAGRVPLRRHAEVVAAALQRARDAAVLVRKQAVALLAALLAHNPYGQALRRAPWAERRRRVEEAVEAKAEAAQQRPSRTQGTEAEDNDRHESDGAVDEDQEDEDPVLHRLRKVVSVFPPQCCPRN